MSDKRIPGSLFFAILAAALVQGLRDFPRLPERMASHFAASGMPNGWMDKRQFFLLYAVVILAAFFVEFRLARSVAGNSGSKLNLPNKDYWLAPERRVHTAQKLQSFLVGFGNVTLLFLLLVFREAMQANLLPSPQLSNRIWVFLVLLGVWSIVGTVRLLRAFRLPD